jgi:hypothetical protein
MVVWTRKVVISFHIPVESIKEVIIPLYPIFINHSGDIIGGWMWSIPDNIQVKQTTITGHK